MPHDLARWTSRRLGRDLAVGAALPVVFAVAVTVVAVLVHLPSRGAVWAVLIAVGVLVVDGLGFVVVRRTASRRGLIAFPLVVVTGLVALAACTDGMVTALAGFFVLAVTYTGLTQGRWTVMFVVAGASAGWLYTQLPVTAEIVVRLVMVLVVYSITGLALSILATKERREALDWVSRANRDALTGLKNRPSMLAHLDREIRGGFGSHFVVLLIDLDGFKAINDVFGHSTGDEALRVLAGRMTATVRENDVVARLGGDEFAILIRSDLIDAAATAERLIDALGHPIQCQVGRVALTASIGMAGLGQDIDAEAVLASADLAMYAAKRAGKNRAVAYQPALAERDLPRQQLEHDATLALDRDEFLLHYQPVVHLDTGTIIGVEALLRWNHPRLGQLTPGQFLDACEPAGITHRLCRWVLGTACRQAMRWQPSDPGLALSLSVNLSPAELMADDFLADLSHTLTSSALDPALLVLEIDESLALADSPLIRERLDDLRRLGVRIAIDDFGTSCSSLAELRDMPADIVKIDPTFVTALEEHPRGTAMIEAIVALAAALDLDVIGEGVESAGQAERLAEHGCHVAQGYHLGTPMPPSQLEEQLAQLRSGQRRERRLERD